MPTCHGSEAAMTNASHALQALVEQVREAGSQRRPLCIRSGGTKAFLGHAEQGEHLDPRGLQGVVDYDPSELVITVRAGTLLSEVEALLAAQGQMLAFEPPHFGAGATVGGCVAAGLAGPRRMAGAFPAGAVRDHVLGAQLLDGRGRVLGFGGTVMKNVAGYDVSRVLAGSLGILGVITQLSLKVLPRPACTATLAFLLDEAVALQRCQAWAGQPLPVTASSWIDGCLTVRLEGSEPGVADACRRMGGERLPAAQALAHWQDLREQRLSCFTLRHAALWRIALPPGAPALDLPGLACIEWGGAQRWYHSEQPDTVLRAVARQYDGHATRWRGGDRRQGVFTPLPPAVHAIHQRLKHEFDPASIFNPGRLVEGL
jgi:glycolate oxidase FAD binding subunit